ncbi:hypothetical protein XM38_052560 [Halomicronema hongdechloris C2206]|uniref:Nif11 domain-containing protein n=1 Tax=Halomicronema hongdechloris C2206 TaxID=1641165 RepID=A0A1V8NIB7_9CYAN|nr:Nif11-like leader peptide family natural product precursor [Halomicronema hongdechloris]ASC74281.1 hypothetical protein XM38_052560 [Halomicronema hongdechloris C2206]
MSKEKALDFLSKAAEDQQLKQRLQDADHPNELVNLAQQHGYEFSSDHLKQAIPAIQEKRGFFGDLVDAVLELFGPNHDDYPPTGVQPFSGDPNK